MYLIIDNYDSFVYNLAAYFKELNCHIIVKRNDEITTKEVDALNLEAIIISPGPKTPTETGVCLDIIKEYQGKIPILGVCLGHQVIAHSFGATTEKGVKPVHGKVTPISHNNEGLFKGLPSSYLVTRYHSLVVNPLTLPPEINIDAMGEDKTVMAISHKNKPIYGLQFHPEAVLTENGHSILKNFVKLTKEWWLQHDANYQGIKTL